MKHSPDSSLTTAEIGIILETLRAEVRTHRQNSAQPDQDPIMRDLQRSLDEIELYRVVSAHWPLVGTSLPQKAINLINKVVRRGLRWYINPIVEQQNAYNDAVARSLRALTDAYTDLAEQMAERPQDGDNDPQKHTAAPQPAVAATPSAPATSYSELRAQQAALAAAEPEASFPDLELSQLEPQLKLRQEVSAHWPLESTNLFERAIALFHQIQRRYLRWLINPIVEQQNGANAAFTVALLQLIRLDAERRVQAAAWRAGKR